MKNPFLFYGTLPRISQLEVNAWTHCPDCMRNLIVEQQDFVFVSSKGWITSENGKVRIVPWVVHSHFIAVCQEYMPSCLVEVNKWTHCPDYKRNKPVERSYEDNSIYFAWQNKNIITQSDVLCFIFWLLWAFMTGNSHQKGIDYSQKIKTNTGTFYPDNKTVVLIHKSATCQWLHLHSSTCNIVNWNGGDNKKPISWWRWMWHGCIY